MKRREIFKSIFGVAVAAVIGWESVKLKGIINKKLPPGVIVRYSNLTMSEDIRITMKEKLTQKAIYKEPDLYDRLSELYNCPIEMKNPE